MIGRAAVSATTTKRRLLLIGLSAVLVAAGCSDSGSDDGGASGPGVTSSEIKFAVLGTGPSNPLGACYLECYQNGVQAYFDYRNSQGGVHGRKLTVAKTVDDEYSNTRTKLLELTTADVFGIFAAPVNATGYADVAKAGVPLYTHPTGAIQAEGHDNIFTPGIICADCKRKDVVQGAVLAKATKVGVIGLSGSQPAKVCVAAIKDSIDTFGPAAGVKAVYTNDTVPPGVPNGLAAEVTAMREAGVDYISTCFDQNTELKLEQELERQGVGNIPVTLLSGYGDTKFLGTNAKLLEGDLIVTNYRPLEANPQGTVIPEMKKWFEKDGYQLEDIAIYGWIDADMAYTGILKAGEDFNRESVVKATNQITDYTAGGLLSGINFTKWHGKYTAKNIATEGQNYDCTGTVRVHNGGVELVGDPAKPFYCYDRTSPEWKEPQQESKLLQ